MLLRGEAVDGSLVARGDAFVPRHASTLEVAQRVVTGNCWERTIDWPGERSSGQLTGCALTTAAAAQLACTTDEAVEQCTVSSTVLFEY